MSHIYSDTFFNYIDQGARRSAREILALLAPQLQPTSVVDFGAGRNVWLDEWRKTGAQDILAVDEDYVDRHQLAVPQENFMAADLTALVHIDRLQVFHWLSVLQSLLEVGIRAHAMCQRHRHLPSAVFPAEDATSKPAEALGWQRGVPRLVGRRQSGTRVKQATRVCAWRAHETRASTAK